MASGTVFLVLSFICVIPGCALLWRVYDASETISGNLQRLAQYESCSFLFFWVVNAAIAHMGRESQKVSSVLRTLSIGVLLYITVYGNYVNFNNLNNLRIVEMSSNKQYNIPNSTTVLDTVNARKLLGGLILGYFSLFFGLLSTLKEIKMANISGMASFFWIFSLALAIPGVVVCWTNGYVPTYTYPMSDTDRYNQSVIFEITTVTMVEFIVLTLGLLAGADDLLASSAFIFGVYGAFIPIAYFYLQSLSPKDSDYIWAGPILCWIATWCMSISASFAENGKAKEQVV